VISTGLDTDHGGKYNSMDGTLDRGFGLDLGVRALEVDNFVWTVQESTLI
jgi:hypothetical protein